MDVASLAQENAALKALLARSRSDLMEHQTALAASEEARRRLEIIIDDPLREKFGSKSEKLTPDQYNLLLEDVEIAQGVLDAAQEKAEAIINGKSDRRDRSRASNRGRPPVHLPRVERVVEPRSTMCPCGCGPMTMIGEDVSERLDVIQAQFRVLVTRRPKYACRRCSGAVAQAQAPEHVVPGGLPTETLIAQVIVAKFGDHPPFYRQAEISAARASSWIGRRPATGRARLLSSLTDHRPHVQASRLGGPRLHGRNDRSGSRSWTRTNQEGLLLGDSVG